MNTETIVIVVLGLAAVLFIGRMIFSSLKVLIVLGVVAVLVGGVTGVDWRNLSLSDYGDLAESVEADAAIKSAIEKAETLSEIVKENDE